MEEFSKHRFKDFQMQYIAHEHQRLSPPAIFLSVSIQSAIPIQVRPRITYIDTGFRCGVVPCDHASVILFYGEQAEVQDVQSGQSLVVCLLDIRSCTKQLLDDVFVSCAGCGTSAGVRNVGPPRKQNVHSTGNVESSPTCTVL